MSIRLHRSRKRERSNSLSDAQAQACEVSVPGGNTNKPVRGEGCTGSAADCIRHRPNDLRPSRSTPFSPRAKNPCFNRNKGSNKQYKGQNQEDARARMEIAHNTYWLELYLVHYYEITTSSIRILYY